MPPTCPLLVFTDLDGTLLDHDSYSFAPARPALAALARAGCPVILASSKTAAEILPLQDHLGLTGLPAIVENGAGVIGHGTPQDEANDYSRLRGILHATPPALRNQFRGFGDMTTAEVADLTGLPTDDAARARDRRFSEPGQWLGTPDARDRFLSELADAGVAARMGGRFLTLSFGQTKADRMAAIAERLGAARTCALGDAPNDVEMLETADLGVIVANPHRAPLPPLAGEGDGRIRRTELAGPDGWNAAMLGILSELGLNGRGAGHG